MPRSIRHLVPLALAVALLGLAGCSATPATTSPQSSAEPTASAPSSETALPPIGTIVFDMAHGEVFGPEDTSELGQSQAVRRMQEAGFKVGVNTDFITKEDLASASGLVLAGPMRPLTKDEYIAVNDFVKRGGTLLLTIHVPYPVLAVPAHWGLPVTPEVIMSDAPLTPNDPGVFMAREIEQSYLTDGVDEVLIVSGWPVSKAADNAETVVNTGPAWIDANLNGSREASESASFGVVGSATVGKGHVVVVGDDAIFANVAIGSGDNLQLLDNILRLMSKTLGA